MGGRQPTMEVLVILYNTLLGVAAGTAMILVPLLARHVRRRDLLSVEGWALSLGVLGVIITFLSGAMTVTWPLDEKPQVNILFGEPSLFLGLLVLAAALYLWARGSALTASSADDRHLLAVTQPLAWLIFVLGLILTSCTIAILSLNAFGNAPQQEPVSGALPAGLENGFLGVVYALAAIGCLLAPWAVRNLRGHLALVSGWCLVVSGVALTLYSVLNYYTHIGLLLAT